MSTTQQHRNHSPTRDLYDSSSSLFSPSLSSSEYAPSTCFSYQYSYTDPSSCDSGNSLKRIPKHLCEDEAVMARPLTRAPSAVYQQIPSTSVETYDSVYSAAESIDMDDDGAYADVLPIPTEDAIPPMLPQYRASIVDPLVRPSTPEAFGHLFPSLDRLSIRHDDLTVDGNMNLRVDTSVACTGRRPVTVQLFHLRMQDLARREFSLRRYCRDSGREVCNSKRAYTQPRTVSRPAIQDSVSSAFQTLKSPFHRSSNGSITSHQRRPSTGGSTVSSPRDSASMRPTRFRSDSWSSDKSAPPASTLVPTGSIKLEFSNYARVDVTHHKTRGATRYDFEWWGHNYSWRRAVDATLGTASFHLVRNGTGVPVAHIAPETRSPNQLEEDEWAGGWVPPCHMWISDKSIVENEADVADIIIATGLITLVDDSIKSRWHVKKSHRWSHREITGGMQRAAHPRTFVQDIFHRRHSEPRPRRNPVKAASHTVTAY